MPQYMLLIYGEPSDEPPPERQEELYREWLNYTNALVASGAMVSGAPLEGVDAARTVRVRDGDTLTAQGPFLDTREILGGYYLVDVPDVDAAIALAAQMPNIENGTVEVRPVVVFPQ
ncbi:MAG TPA: YciI family protein [Solirubrobacteraceae bacterium]|jgi:hypothetical protein|nr:YciI family protein [Solirubrobacteraceae bacterium]